MKKIFPLILLLFYMGCDDTTTNIDKEVIPDSNVSYSQHIQPIFNAKCINCHGAGTTEAGLDLTTWAGTTANPSIVSKGEPDNSILVWTVEYPARAGFPQMPPLDSPYLPLTPNQLRGLKTWIAEGAEYN
jgi:mono/diheme cytochrome c family protein